VGTERGGELARERNAQRQTERREREREREGASKAGDSQKNTSAPCNSKYVQYLHELRQHLVHIIKRQVFDGLHPKLPNIPLGGQWGAQGGRRGRVLVCLRR